MHATNSSLATTLSSAAQSSPVEPLVRYSRLLGSDPTLVLRGGGNTSVKADGFDHAGRALRILYVKGSGSDLATVNTRDFTPLCLNDLLLLRAQDDMSDEAMVDYLLRCRLDPDAPRPSIETLLHAFLPAASVFHSHADAILGLINTVRPGETLRAALGDAVAAVPYRRPGFLLSREVADAASDPRIRAVVLLNHGLVAWGDSPEDAFRAHAELVQRAQEYVRARATTQVFVSDAVPSSAGLPAARLAPILRGALSRDRRVILIHDGDPETLRFVNSSRARAASAAGAATPDHILTTKRLPLWLDVDASSDETALTQCVDAALERYRQEYLEYVARWRTNEPVLEAAPRVILVPGVGMFTAGRDRAAAILARDIYRHTMQIMESAETLGGYRSLDEAESFRAEYWPLELYKLTLAPPERELARRIALITGAGSGLGRACALRLASAGAHVLVTDIDAESASETMRLVAAQHGSAAVFGQALDVTAEADIERAVERVCLEFGGLDIVVSNAGYAHCASIEQLELADWERSLAVNATGHFLITRAALRLFRQQRTGGNIVFVATKNVVAPGRDFAAYSAAKSAEAQLARVAAIEGGPLGVRVNMVNPDAIFSGSHLWDEIRQQRASAHGIAPEQMEAFYRGRSLLGVEVRAEDVAEAVLFLATERSSRTTGAMIPVDAGVREAFVR